LVLSCTLRRRPARRCQRGFGVSTGGSIRISFLTIRRSAGLKSRTGIAGMSGNAIWRGRDPRNGPCNLVGRLQRQNACTNPGQFGLLALNREISVYVRLRGGPGRFSTCRRNQGLRAKVRQLSAFEGEREIFSTCRTRSGTTLRTPATRACREFNKHPRLWHSRPVEEPSTASKTDIPDHSTDASFTPQSGHRLSWKSLFAWDCVVELGGLEPPTKRLLSRDGRTTVQPFANIDHRLTKKTLAAISVGETVGPLSWGSAKYWSEWQDLLFLCFITDFPGLFQPALFVCVPPLCTQCNSTRRCTRIKKRRSILPMTAFGKPRQGA
jgi:hypothetical protein